MIGTIRSIMDKFNRYTEIFIAFGIIAIIGIIIIPIPSGFLDFLLVCNISLGVIVLLLTLFTKNVLEFSTFPTLLLVATMFRLALNISSTRLILGEGDAGHVINAFANFVTGNNYIVGAVVFIIITIVQMVVVTNGAGRVSEVTARFTLDAMPGKQMAIDADLNAGLIDEQSAKLRRKNLEREANFYGAMDGASKFVKGDAIAGIIITLVNLVGGILIFSVRDGIGIMDALDKFGKLTIGDGLVGQVPALLISIASGILVTRSDDGQSFGTSLVGELFGVSQVMIISAAVLFLIGLVPAFPMLPFTIVALGLGITGYLLIENDKAEIVQNNLQAEQAIEYSREIERDEGVSTFQVEPISLEIGYGLIPLVDEGNDDNLIAHITSIRRQCANELGIIVNPIRIRDNLQLSPNDYIIKIKGNKVAEGQLYINRFLVIDPGSSEFDLDGIGIESKDKEMAELNDYTIVEPVTVIATHLKEIIKDNSQDLMGRQEVKQLLEGIKEKYNVVVDELIPDIMSLGEVQKVLQNLLRENVPIYDLVTILEVLADNGIMTKDTEVLTEHVRHALKRTIVKRYLNEEGSLMVITLHPDLEEFIASNMRKTMAGSMPVLDPNSITKILDSIKKINDKMLINGIEPVILSSPKIRVAFRNLISFNFPGIPVLSINEIPNDIEITAIGLVETI